MGWGYTCFASAFAFFISEKEIKLQKSAVIAAFNDINTEDAFNALNLPIKNVIECGDGLLNKAFEIDLL
jgi:organic hydroperoxide reductase OsmC/OhrA